MRVNLEVMFTIFIHVLDFNLKIYFFSLLTDIFYQYIVVISY